MIRSLLTFVTLSLLHVSTNGRQFHSLEELHRAEQAQWSTGAPQQLSRRNAPYQQWRPAVQSRIQMILSGVLDMNATVALHPAEAEVFDIDLFDNNSTRIADLKAKGKKVICYFSAGTAEDWRPDHKKFSPNATGHALPLWPGEKWLNTRDPSVLRVMFQRIRLAWAVGCDAVDPDNMDGYSNEGGGGFAPALTMDDSIRYVRNLAFVSHLYGLGMGLKNADDVLPFVQDVVDFAVNEQCMTYSPMCSQYESFVNGSWPTNPPKAVYHVEYVSRVPAPANYTPPVPGTMERRNAARARVKARPRMKARQLQAAADGTMMLITSTDFPNITTVPDIRNKYCVQEKPQLAAKLNTIIKTMDLSGWVMYCDGENSETALISLGTKARVHPEAPDGVNIIAANATTTLPPVSVATDEAQREANEQRIIDHALAALPVISPISPKDAVKEIYADYTVVEEETPEEAEEDTAVRIPLNTMDILDAPFAELPASYHKYNEETDAIIAAFKAKRSTTGIRTYRGSAAKDVIPSKKWLQAQA